MIKYFSIIACLACLTGCESTELESSGQSGTFRYDMREPGSVTFYIENSYNTRVRTLLFQDFQQAGYYSISWDGKNDDGKDVPQGVYFYNLIIIMETETYSRTKMFILK